MIKQQRVKGSPSDPLPLTSNNDDYTLYTHTNTNKLTHYTNYCDLHTTNYIIHTLATVTNTNYCDLHKLL